MPRLLPLCFAPLLMPVAACLLMGGVLSGVGNAAFAQASPGGATSAGASTPDTANPDSPPDEPSPAMPGADNPLGEDGDGAANDDPVWGYFLGKSGYILFRELARAMSAQDGLKSIADDAAKQEQLTALLITTEGKKHFGGTALADAVVGWIVSWRQGQQPDAAVAGADASSPDAAPDDDAKANGWDAANLSATQMSDLLCALYGSDPMHFHGLIESGDIKADKTQACIAGYRKLTEQWQLILRQAGLTLTVTEAASAGGAAPTMLSLDQRASNAPDLADFTGWLHDVGLVANLLVETNRDLTPAAPIKVVLLQCGKNAPAAPQKSEAPICYEWLKSVYDAATAQNVEAPPE